MTSPTTFNNVILLSHDTLQVIMTVLKMGFVKILSWISVVHRNDQNMSENGIRTYNLSSECLWSINHLATRKNLETKFSQSLQCCSSQTSWASGSWRPSCSSCKSWRGQIHPKILISHPFRAHYRYPKSKCWTFKFFINNFSQNALWNQKPLSQPARQIWTPLHCKCNVSVTVARITKWLGHTIHR